MITFDYDATTDLVRSKVAGEFTAAITVRVRTELRDSALCGKRALIDVTQAAAMFSSKELEHLARTEPLFGDVALVARPNSGTYSVCRNFQLHRGRWRKVGCFDNLEHANMWLSGDTTVDVSQVNPPTEQYQLVSPIVWYAADDRTGADVLPAGAVLEIVPGLAPNAWMVECEADGKDGFVSIDDLRRHCRRVGGQRKNRKESTGAERN